MTDRTALVEKVAVAIRAEVRRMLENPPCEYEALATAAIDLIRAEVLEEAARVAEGPAYRTSGTTGEVSIRGNDAGNWSVPMPLSGFKGSDYGTGRYNAAAAIRALKEKPHDR